MLPHSSQLRTQTVRSNRGDSFKPRAETKEVHPTADLKIGENEDMLEVIAAAHAQKQADLDQCLQGLQRSLWELKQSNPLARPPGSPLSVYPQLVHVTIQSIGGRRALEG